MEMEMELTQTFLRGKNPCAAGYRWFVRNGLSGKDYQAAMDTQVRAGRVEDARWLLENFGATSTVLELDSLEADNFVYAGTLIVHGDVRVPGQLLVGRSLQTGAGIRAGTLEVGEDIHSAGAIFSDTLLRAGGHIKATWSIEVQGDIRAEHLRCGWELRCGGQVQLQGEAVVGQHIEIDGALQCGKGLRAGGNIHVRGLLETGHGITAQGEIVCGNHIQTGWGIKALGDIRAACSIRAGESLDASGEIHTGEGYGIYAGLNVQMQSWPDCAWVRALRKPQALVSGWWERQEAMA